MRARAFTLLEIGIVVVVIGIGGALALSVAAEQVLAARVRSDAHGIALRVRDEQRRAKERLEPMQVVVNGDDPQLIEFVRANVTFPQPASALCVPDRTVPPVATAHFEHARLVVPTTGATNALCQDAHGLPLGSTALQIVAARGGGSLSDFSLDAAAGGGAGLPP
jgi:type II secretory pathway pseudopilin PulG